MNFLWKSSNEDSYFKIRTKYDFSKKVEKKFLDAVWQYWRYLEVSPDQGGHFLSLGFLIWSLPPKKSFYITNLKDIESMRFCQNILSPFWASFFKNLNFFHFSRHIIWLVCRMVMIFLLAQRYNLCKLFRYLEHARKVHRNVSKGFSKKVLLKKKWGFVRIFYHFLQA